MCNVYSRFLCKSYILGFGRDKNAATFSFPSLKPSPLTVEPKGETTQPGKPLRAKVLQMLAHIADLSSTSD